MALVDSLLSAMIRAGGDALVMHVGEKPYVVTQAGTLDLSTHGLNLSAMSGMLQQLLPAELMVSLDEFGAVEHRLPSIGEDGFTVVAARGGDDIWIEIRRRRLVSQAAVAEPAPSSETVTVPVEMATEPVETVAEPAAEAPVEVVADSPLEPAALVLETAAASEPVTAPSEEVFAIAAEDDAGDALLTEWAAEFPEAAVAETPTVTAMPVADDPPAADELLEPAPMAMTELLLDSPEETAEDAFDIPSEDEDGAALAAELAAGIQARATVPEETPVVIAPIALDDPLEMPADVIELSSTGETIDETLEAALEATAPPAIEAPINVESVQVIEAAAEIIPEAVAESLPVTEAETELIPEAAVAELTDAVELPSEPIEAAESAVPVSRESTGPTLVVPLTRVGRSEAPRQPAHLRASTVDRLLRLAAARGASALFLLSASRPSIRLEGDIRPIDNEPLLSKADVEAAIMEIVPENAQESVGRGEATEWIAELQDLGRVRCTNFRDHRGPGVMFSMIATRPATAEQLGLAREVQALATEAQGIVVVAGPRGSGKSTLISALVDLVNRQRAEYVITLERQIRLVHDHRTALVSQREIRGGADDVLVAARAALRENPDVLVVDDLNSAQMVPLLLDAAADGLLVFVSITAPSTADAVQRLVELAPPESCASVQAAMAETFRGAVSQVWLKKSGGGRIAAREVLLATAPVTRVIEEGQFGQLPLALEGGRRHGMVPLTDVLVGYVQSGVVDAREAFRKTHDRERLLSALKREGVDTTAVERLA